MKGNCRQGCLIEASLLNSKVCDQVAPHGFITDANEGCEGRIDFINSNCGYLIKIETTFLSNLIQLAKRVHLASALKYETKK